MPFVPLAIEGGPEIETYYEVAGEGFPVVLIHGVGMDLTMWEAQAAALGRHYKLVRYDTLGHGQSSKPPGPYRMEWYVAQLDGLARALGVRRFALIGFSMGGLIAQAYALGRPEALAALIVMNAVHGRTEAERAAVVARARANEEEGGAAMIDAALERWFTREFAAANPVVIERVRRRILSNDRQGYSAAYWLMATCDAALADRIARIACPALIVTSENDLGSNVEMTLRMARLIPGATAEIIPRLRHLAIMEDPQRVNDILAGFLARSLA